MKKYFIYTEGSKAVYIMDFSAILAYKSLFFLNRASNTKKQADNGDKCTAAANAARCTITASQGIVPLYAVSECLAHTAETPTIKKAAQRVAESNLQKIATQMTSSTTKSALNSLAGITKGLSKLGIAGNITYAAAKCMDAREEDKTQVFMQASGNCAGMYLFENLYSRALKDIAPDNLSKTAEQLSKVIPNKLKLLKSIKPTSVITGVGFVAASLFGCWAGEKVGGTIYEKTTPNQKLQLKPAYAQVNPNINSIA